MSNEKTHNISSLPKTDQSVEEEAAEVKTRWYSKLRPSNLSPRAKMFAVGIGTGAAATLAAIHLVRNGDDEGETELEVEETPEG